jgi:site-specific DNA-adenine methylase
MWGYYGSKSKIVNKYPVPSFDKIIEPFAGTAQYSLKYFDRDILLIEKYDVIVRLWKWLQQCSKKDILNLPRLKCGENVDNFTWDCDEAKWLVGFIITGAPSQPKKTASRWKTVIRPNTQEYKLKLISENLFKIKHWKIEHSDYKDLKNENATWFIDPPYQHGGQYYKFGNKDINFEELSEWCKNRFGQIVVCENSKATWLPFKPLVEMRGNKFKTTECVFIKD